jgi:gamma-glutamylcyclotransferase (GGCT)/AIG2-like uncharacterized protein YtfP
MLSFFVYGTLMDPDLRAAVLGGPCVSLRPAVLAGYRRRTVVGEDYPAIAPAKNSRVAGLLVAGISPAMAARASIYEGDQYDAVSLTVATTDGAACDAWTFLPQADVRLSTRDWSLDTWQKHHKSRVLTSARAFLSADPAGGFRRTEAIWRARLRD